MKESLIQKIMIFRRIFKTFWDTYNAIFESDLSLENSKQLEEIVKDKISKLEKKDRILKPWRRTRGFFRSF